jgi:hypothetical protein
LYFVPVGCLWVRLLRDKKVVRVFVRFRAPFNGLKVATVPF